MVQSSLVSRGRPGFFLPGMIAAFYGVAVYDSAVDIVVTSVMAAVLLLVGSLRQWFSRVETLRADPRQWQLGFAALCIASISLFEGFAAFTLWHRSVDAGSLLIVAASIALRASGSHTLSPDRGLVLAFNRWTRLPTFLALAIVASHIALVTLALLVLHSLFIEVHSKQLNAEYWETITAHEAVQAAHAELTQEVAVRQRAEVELRLAQKLESVGRLAAGIAHEINTPLQAMVGCLDFAEEGTRDLIALTERCRNNDPDALGESDREDLEYLVHNLPDAMALAKTCLDRAATIVRSVKTFAHPSTDAKCPTDLNEALITTLDIARHEYAEHADVHLRLSDLPLVECYAGELNQALLNIVVNAAQAIESARTSSSPRGSITVTTTLTGDDVRIAIADSGGGIPPDIHDRVFDPFFTTKGVGRGSGQGLAVAHSVINKRHGGALSFTTELGRGTEFVIVLPARGAVPQAHVNAA